MPTRFLVVGLVAGLPEAGVLGVYHAGWLGCAGHRGGPAAEEVAAAT